MTPTPLWSLTTLEKLPKSSMDLDELVLELQNRRNKDTSGSCSPVDVYEQLRQKEEDLVLAAELGKLLLDKTRELEERNDRVCTEYARKMELLEQEKHSMRRKLDSIEGEHESKMAEVSGDIMQLRREIDSQRLQMAHNERERLCVIEELGSQNQRLTQRLKEAGRSEELLHEELERVRKSALARTTNFNDHIGQLELLREEINMMSEKRLELERRLRSASCDRDSLCAKLDESADCALLAQKRMQDQLNQLHNQTRELSELRQANIQLQDRLDSISRTRTSPATSLHLAHHPTSLLNEIEMSSGSSDQDDSALGSSYGSIGARFHSTPTRHSFAKRRLSMRVLRDSRRKNALLMDANDNDDIECDDIDTGDYVHSGADSQHSLLQYKQEYEKLHEEVFSTYQEIQSLCAEIRLTALGSHMTSSSSSTASDDVMCQLFKAGMLTDIVGELRGVLHEILRKETKGACAVCGRSWLLKEEIERELSVAKEAGEKLARGLADKKEEVRHKLEEIFALNSKVSLQETEISAFREECCILRRDLTSSHLSTDEAVVEARHSRDDALRRKNNIEMELAQSRIDIMHVSSQLIEAIQQKLELSQQLEMWQVDMHSLIDDQMRKKLGQTEKRLRKYSETSASGSGGQTNKSKSLFGLWN